MFPQSSGVCCRRDLHTAARGRSGCNARDGAREETHASPAVAGYDLVTSSSGTPRRRHHGAPHGAPRDDSTRKGAAHSSTGSHNSAAAPGHSPTQSHSQTVKQAHRHICTHAPAGTYAHMSPQAHRHVCSRRRLCFRSFRMLSSRSRHPLLLAGADMRRHVFFTHYVDQRPV